MIVRITKMKNNSFIFTYAIHYLQNIFLHLFRYYFFYAGTCEGHTAEVDRNINQR